TGNMSGHVEKCWGQEAVNTVKDSTLDKACLAIKTFGKKSQTQLTAALKRFKRWAETFSTCPPEKKMACVVTAQWVAESAHLFHIVHGRYYHWLQKEGCPKHYLPSKETVAWDMKKLYTKTKAKLAEEPQVSP
ncbi:hypothetical protein BT96DRAFT_818311, partial [Gymnopus androsaceus JB14]